MADMLNLNFTQMIAPQGGGVPAAAGGQNGLLSSASTGAAGVLAGAEGAGGEGIGGALFNLLLGNNNGLLQQEKISSTGQNLPLAPSVSKEVISKDNLKTEEGSIDAMQAVLAGLILQQQAAGAPQQQPVAQTGDAATGEAGAIDPAALLNGKTLEAYRAADTLGKVTAGKTVDVPDTAIAPQALEALTAPAANLSTATDIASATASTAEAPKAEDTIAKLLGLKQNNPDALSDAMRQLRNMSSVTPLPATVKQADDKEASKKPLDQLASMETTLTPVKPEVDKLVNAVKQTSAAAQEKTDSKTNVTQEAVTPLVNAQTQNNAEKNIASSVEVKEQEKAISAVDDMSKNGPAQVKDQPQLVADKVDPKLFAAHMSRAMASPADQIAMKIASMPAGKQNITVQLEPANLGKVDIKLEWTPDGQTQIVVAAERKETLDMLKNDMSSLQRSLADSGIKTDASNLQFNMKGQEQFAGLMGDGKNQGQQQNKYGTQEQQVVALDTSTAAARYAAINNLVDLMV